MIICGFGISSTIFNFILTAIINPDSIKADPVTKIYPPVVSDSVPKFILVLLIAQVIFGAIAIILINPNREAKKTELEQMIEDHVNKIDLYLHNEFQLNVERFHFTIKNSPPVEVKPKEKGKLLEINFTEYSEDHLSSSNRNKGSPLQKERIEVSIVPNPVKPIAAHKHHSVSWNHEHINMVFLDRHDEVYKMAENHPKVKKSVKTHSLHTAIFSTKQLKYCLLVYCINCKLFYLICI